MRGRPGRAILDAALEGLRRVGHRGAVAADGLTGDGAGVLLPLAPALVPGPWCGLAMVFLRDEAARCRVEAACAAEGLGIVGWRLVPTDPRALGDAARESVPHIEQLVVQRPLGAGPDEAERRAFRARKRLAADPGAYVCSLSFRTVTYKALCAAGQLAAFYPDLRDESLAVPFAIFHQRFSTNTEPSWERAQPFRLLCHNGEINAIDGNVNWMRSRAASLSPGPTLEPGGSDSALLDNALELLVRGGRDVRHATAMLLPEAWEADPVRAERVRDFYRYHATLVEPWDGPAAIVFTDGRVVGAALDRNGLRPLRYAVTDGGLMACASEAGAIPLPTGAQVRRGRLGPGQMLAVDPHGFGFEESEAIKRRLSTRRPHRRWLGNVEAVSSGMAVEPPAEALSRRQIVAGFTREDISLVLRPTAAGAREPTSSMGDDTALPPLAGRARPLYAYFRQRFAQVTNPPIDHLRERSVMSVRTLLGARAGLLQEGPAPRLRELESFFLFPSALDDLAPARLDASFTAEEGLRLACLRLAVEAMATVANGAELLLLSDERAVAEERMPVPALLAVGAVNRRLVEAGLRTRASILVESEEPRESHHFACLLGYGADAICPRLALQTLAALAAADKLGGDHPSPADAQLRFRQAVEDGVLKVMSKMGISDLASYRGAQLFDTLGLGRDVVDAFFPGTPAPAGGIGLEDLELECLDRFAAASGESAQLENTGYVKFRKGGEPHATNPEVVGALQEMTAAHALRRALNGGGTSEYERYAALVNGREPLELRDLLEFVSAATPVPLEEVEPAAAIVTRFSSGGMSHGSLSAEAHETIAVAFNRLGARSNCGEGGEDPERFRTNRNSRIKQVASGRFGVTPEYAAFADELQIKIAQGSKPGEGGQLPAHKVTGEIAALRHTQPGIELISPPPHHDIYSIEDLAQLVFDLKQVNAGAAVSVKLVSETGIGLVAAGVAKTLADVVHVAGCDGGTGASPLSSIKNAGLPWELGLAETQQALTANGLRSRVRLRVDGGLKTGRDVLVAALLGADEFSFGTALLIAEGCLMVRSCHLDTCPVGIATQRPELRAKYAATPDVIEAYVLYVAEEVRRRLALMGVRSLGEAVGRTDLLRPRTKVGDRAALLQLEPLLAVRGGAFAGDPSPEPEGGELGELFAADAAPALAGASLLDLAYPITNRDRAVGARLGGRIGRLFGAHPPEGRVRVRFEGAAGQSFGAFLAAGVKVTLVGEANDGVGKSMGGGRIAISPPPDDAGDPVLIGNAALYGATGGELYCAGRAGERFAVRNSGATAVVEGVGDHACEYMTGGTVVILGEAGLNLGAGMTGGVAYVHDRDRRLPQRLNQQLVWAERVEGLGPEELRALLERHARYTGSPRAADLLDVWENEAGWFWRIASRADAVAAETAGEGFAEVAVGG